MFSKTNRLLPLARRYQYVASEKGRKGCTSSLYITGDQASGSFVVVTPHVDLNERFQNLDKLQKNLQHRDLRIDVKSLKATWDKLQAVKKFKYDLEAQKAQNVTKTKLFKEADEKILKEMKKEYHKIREQLKDVNKEIWNLEKDAVIGGLALPNDLHGDTPVTPEEKVVHMFGSKPSCASQHTHLEIAEKLGVLDYYDSSFYFLRDDAAEFELGLTYLFLDSFCDNGFVQMSNSDFGRSVAVEGVGLDPTDSNSVFVLKRDEDERDPNVRAHLVGGASLVSFCAFHAKTITNKLYLPLRYVTVGRHYSPDNSNGLVGLFSTWQSSAVEAFIAAGDQQSAIVEFESLLKLLIDIYTSLGYHFRVVYLPPKSLKAWESLRASVQMYSQNLQTYVEVGNICLCDDYISKRLLICCSNNDQSPREFAHIVSGTLVSVPRVLGCVLENDPKKFSIASSILSKVKEII